MEEGASQDAALEVMTLDSVLYRPVLSLKNRGNQNSFQMAVLHLDKQNLKAYLEEGVQAYVRASSLLNDTIQATEQPSIASSSPVIHIKAIQVRQIDQLVRVHTVSRGIAEDQVDQLQEKVPQHKG